MGVRDLHLAGDPPPDKGLGLRRSSDQGLGILGVSELLGFRVYWGFRDYWGLGFIGGSGFRI